MDKENKDKKKFGPAADNPAYCPSALPPSLYVISLNNKRGNVQLTSNEGTITIAPNANESEIDLKITPQAVVDSLNANTGDVTIGNEASSSTIKLGVNTSTLGVINLPVDASQVPMSSGESWVKANVNEQFGDVYGQLEDKSHIVKVNTQSVSYSDVLLSMSTDSGLQASVLNSSATQDSTIVIGVSPEVPQKFIIGATGESVVSAVDLPYTFKSSDSTVTFSKTQTAGEIDFSVASSIAGVASLNSHTGSLTIGNEASSSTIKLGINTSTSGVINLPVEVGVKTINNISPTASKNISLLSSDGSLSISSSSEENSINFVVSPTISKSFVKKSLADLAIEGSTIEGLSLATLLNNTNKKFRVPPLINTFNDYLPHVTNCFLDMYYSPHVAGFNGWEFYIYLKNPSTSEDVGSLSLDASAAGSITAFLEIPDVIWTGSVSSSSPSLSVNLSEILLQHNANAYMYSAVVRYIDGGVDSFLPIAHHVFLSCAYNL